MSLELGFGTELPAKSCRPDLASTLAQTLERYF
jgi:hypothetical protein